MAKLALLVAFALVGICSANLRGVGLCPRVKVMPNFDLQKYLGTWYEFAKYPQIFEADGKCNTANYYRIDDGKVGVRNEQVNTKTWEKEEIVGSATPVGNAKLIVTFPINENVSTSSDYWVLDTDYVNYSVVYSCQTATPLVHHTSAWILTREREPAAEYILKAAKAMTDQEVSLKELVKTDQNDCTKKNSVTIKCTLV